MALNSIAPFIDEGWWTAPLVSTTVTRDKNGKKIFRAPKGWNEYQHIFNDVPAPVGALITGEKSKVVVLDCDEQSISAIALGLVPPNYEGITKSIGKLDKDGNTINALSIFFSYTAELPPTLNTGPMGLEWFNGGSARMVFLPTQNNKTKEPWDKVPTLIPPPQPLIDLIIALSAKTATQSATQSTYEPQHSTNLAPILVQELEFKRQDYTLFSIITPKRYKGIMPKDLPSGAGSDYLIRVSAILGSDESVDPDLYLRFMEYINSLKPDPHTPDRLAREITSPMVNGTSQINNEPIWRYNKHWEKDRLTVINGLNHSMEYMYDPLTFTMYEINHTRGIVGTFSKNDIVAIVSSTVSKKLPHQQLKFMQMLPNYEVFLRPSRPFGPLNTYEYNIFKSTPYLELINNPQAHQPTTQTEEAEAMFHDYITHLVPDEVDRTYLLNHLYTKLTTFKYSSVVYYIVGAAGSGKGTLVRIISKLIGSSYIAAELGKSEISEKFNGWLMNKYFVHFDELHNQLDAKETRAANERIKSWSGADTFSLRKMRTDSETDVPMLATFIFTQNGNNMRFDSDDRRYLYIDTPKKMEDSLSEYFDTLTDEKMEGIANYIATNATLLKHKEYKEPPFTERKQQQIIDKMPLIDKIVYYINKEEYSELYTMACDAGVDKELLSNKHKDMIFIDVLENLIRNLNPSYDEPGPRLNLVIKEILSGQPTHPYTTTSGGGNRKYLIAHEFKDWYPPIEETDTKEEVSL